MAFCKGEDIQVCKECVNKFKYLFNKIPPKLNYREISQFNSNKNRCHSVGVKISKGETIMLNLILFIKSPFATIVM